MKSLFKLLLVASMCLPFAAAQTNENIKVGQWGSFDATQAFHAAPFKVTDTPPQFCNAGADFYWAPTSHTLSFCSATNVWVAFATGTGSGLNPIGVAGIPYETGAGVATRATTAADFVYLFNSGTCSGYLKSDGTCATPAGSVYTNGAGLSLTGNTFAVLYGSGSNTSAQGNDARFGNATKFNGTDVSGFNGFPFFTAGTPASGLYSNVVNLWTSCTAGYLKFDGTCSTPAGGSGTTLSTSGAGTKNVTVSNVTTINLDTQGRVVTGTTDNITNADKNKVVTYSSASNVAVGIAQTPLNIDQGASFTLTNIGSGSVVLTPSTSLIGGAASLTLAGGTPLAPTSVTFTADDTSGNFTITNLNEGSGGFTNGTVITMGTNSGVSNSTGTTTFTFNNTGASAHKYGFSTGDSANSPGQFNIYDYTTDVTAFDLDTTNQTHPSLRTVSGGVYCWDSGAVYAQVGGCITGLSSPSTGVLNIGTGAYGATDGELILNKMSTGTGSNTDLAGQIILSGGTGSYTFSGSYTNTPICVATDASGVNPVEIGTSNTALTITGTGSDVVRYICVARN